jgi:hypothetical protein
MEQWNNGILGLKPIIPIIQYSIFPLIGATGGTIAGGTTAAGGTGGALKLSSARKREGGHHPAHLLAFTFRADDLLRGVENQFFKLVITSAAMIFIDRHLKISFTPLESHGHYAMVL